MIRSLLMLLLLLAITAAMVLVAWGRDVTLRWNPNPEPDIIGYRVYRGIDMLVETAATSAPASVETGDVLGLVAYNTAGVSDPALYTVPPPPLDRAGWILTASSEETAREPAGVANAIDGNSETIWHTRWGSPALPPHYLRIELPRPAVLSGFRYLPRQDGSPNGNVTAYEVEVSDDGITWEKAATGTWTTDASRKISELGLRSARFVRLWGNDPFMAAAEIHLIGSYEPTAPASVTLTPQQSPDMANWSDLADAPAFTVPLSTRQFFRLKIEPTPQP